MKKNCRVLKRQKKKDDGNNLKKDENSNTIAVLCNDEVEILSMGKCLHVGNSSQGIEWVLDNGASFHATSKREFFYSYREGDFGTMKMGNDSYSKVLGIGDICLENKCRLQAGTERCETCSRVAFQSDICRCA